VVGTEDRVRFTLALDRPIEAAVYTVADPYRVIVDLPDVEFRLPPEAGQGRTGLVSGFRYGVFQAGRSRIVLDTAGPVMIDRLSNGRSRAGGAEVAFDIVRIDRAEFQAIAAAEAARGTALRGTRPETSPAPKSAKSGRPVVVIDPGHGGLDPGTVAGADLTEKALVLSVGRQIRAAIAALGRIDVHLTRSDDVFVPLDERVRMARNLGADLFISLHADAIAEREYTGLVRGATIYTLSDRASDEVARRAAEKENASDILAGVEASAPGEEDHVRSILSDLLKRETSDFSSEIRNLLLDKLKGKVTLSKDPRRSAAFAVLRQAETPSVLMELGYLSNPEDRARMITPEWQRQVAAAVAAAVDQYFAKRPRVSNR
jgi:N-acetylmuramoyl-L-alanine amidase